MTRHAVAAISLFAIAAAHGQVGAARANGSGSGAVASGARTGSPASIAFEITTVQTLADGTHLTRTTHEWFYRDSQGRTRMDFGLNFQDGQESAPRTSVIVRDPLSAETFSWLTGQGLPPVYDVSKIQPVVRPQPRGSSAAAKPVGADVALRPASLPRPTIRREDLGTENVQGATCQGTRTTTEYPIGMLGNDRPITVVSERCMSLEFGRALREHTDDPRTGVRTLTVVSISRGDPDPGVFRPPPGLMERQRPLSVRSEP